jgi:hypothetical protein
MDPAGAWIPGSADSASFAVSALLLFWALRRCGGAHVRARRNGFVLAGGSCEPSNHLRDQLAEWWAASPRGPSPSPAPAERRHEQQLRRPHGRGDVARWRPRGRRRPPRTLRDRRVPPSLPPSSRARGRAPHSSRLAWDAQVETRTTKGHLLAGSYLPYVAQGAAGRHEAPPAKPLPERLTASPQICRRRCRL